MFEDSLTGFEKLSLRLLNIRERLLFSLIKRKYSHRVSFGPDCVVSPGSFKFSGTGRLDIGKGTVIDYGNYPVTFDTGPGAIVKIGPKNWIQRLAGAVRFTAREGATIETGELTWFTGGHLGASERITIGERCVIGWGTTILDSDLHQMDNDSPVKTSPVEIGNHVWLASNVTVLPGVKIGDHCVVGAGGVVTKDIEPNSFAAGNPARIVRKIKDRDRAR